MSSNCPSSNDPADLSFGGNGNNDNLRPDTPTDAPNLDGGNGFPPSATETAVAHIARGIQSGALGHFGHLFNGLLGNSTNGASQLQESHLERPLEAAEVNPLQGPRQSSGGITGVASVHLTQGAAAEHSNVLPAGGGGNSGATIFKPPSHQPQTHRVLPL